MARRKAAAAREVARMSVAQLRSAIESSGLSHAHVLDKDDLRHLAVQALLSAPPEENHTEESSRVQAALLIGGRSGDEEETGGGDEDEDADEDSEETPTDETPRGWAPWAVLVVMGMALILMGAAVELTTSAEMSATLNDQDPGGDPLSSLTATGATPSHTESTAQSLPNTRSSPPLCCPSRLLHCPPSPRLQLSHPLLLLSHHPLCHLHRNRRYCCPHPHPRHRPRQAHRLCPPPPHRHSCPQRLRCHRTQPTASRCHPIGWASAGVSFARSTTVGLAAAAAADTSRCPTARRSRICYIYTWRRLAARPSSAAPSRPS